MAKCEACDGIGGFQGLTGWVFCKMCEGTCQMKNHPIENGNVSYQNLPAGQPLHVVVGMDGKPYIHEERNAPTQAGQLTRGLMQLTESAMVGEVEAMYGIAEVITADGVRLVVVQYGIPSDKPNFTLRMLDVLNRARNA